MASYFSYAFGDGYAASGTDEDPYHFAGTNRDSESGTDHAQFRQYSETAGRWMSPDPYDGSYDWSNPQSLNRYAYAGNNPLGFVDPSGKFTLSVYAFGTALNSGIDLSSVFDFGLSAIADVGLDLLLGDLFAPQFHGSLQPRPSSPSTNPCTDGSDSSSYAESGNAYSGITSDVTVSASPCGSVPRTENAFLCGAEAAGKVSLAGALSHIPGLRSGAGNFVANAVGGNVFSGATDLLHSFATGEGGGHSVFYNMAQGIIAGPTQGFGAAFGKTIEGTPWAADLVDVGTTALVGAEYASGIGEVKLGYDFLTYAGGVAGCAAGIIH